MLCFGSPTTKRLPGGAPSARRRTISELERVGVLELVDQEVADPALEVLPDVRTVAHEVPRPEEQVEEIEAPRPRLRAVVGGDEARGPAGEAGDQVVARHRRARPRPARGAR